MGIVTSTIENITMLLFNSVLLFLVGVHTVRGFFMFDDPCHLEPRYPGGIPKDPDFTVSIYVPSDCTNGTFRWDYPKGHTMVHFNNSMRTEAKICFGEDLGGDIFTIVDLTEGINVTLPHVDRERTDSTVCTPVTESEDILLRIDAPSTMYYMGAVSYVVVS